MSLLRLGYKRTAASVSLSYCEGSQAPCWELAPGEAHGAWQGTDGHPDHPLARNETLSPTALEDPCPAKRQVSRLEIDSTPVSFEVTIAQAGPVTATLRNPSQKLPTKPLLGLLTQRNTA